MKMGLGIEELQKFSMIEILLQKVVMNGRTPMFILFSKDTDKDKRTWNLEILDTL